MRALLLAAISKRIELEGCGYARSQDNLIHIQGRIWRAFRAFPGRPWRRTQDSVGHKTDDKREKKKEKK